jgi:exonuclease VII small subunit
MARVESRIQKFEERGVDVTDAQEKLQKARSAITEADFKLNAARGLVEDILSGEDPKKIFENARETVKSTVISIKQAHRALVDSIVALKGIASLDATEEDE